MPVNPYFKVWDGLRITNPDPPFVDQGFSPQLVVYGAGFKDGDWDDERDPDYEYMAYRLSVDIYLSAIRNYRVVLDPEHFAPYDWIRSGKYSIKQKQFADPYRDMIPGVNLSNYSIFPKRDYWKQYFEPPGSSYALQLDYYANSGECALMGTCSVHYDVTDPSTYLFYEAQGDDRQVNYIQNNITLSKQYGLPIVPWLWWEYHNSGSDSGIDISPERWRLCLDAAYDGGADGVSIWGNIEWEDYDPDDPWLVVTRQFIADKGVFARDKTKTSNVLVLEVPLDNVAAISVPVSDLSNVAGSVLYSTSDRSDLSNVAYGEVSMADHVRYVDLNVVGGAGDGTSWEDAWSDLYDVWDTGIRTLAGDVEVYCRGGVQLWPGPKDISGAATKITIIGDWAGFNFNDDGFLILGTHLTDLTLFALNPNGVPLTLRFENTKIETGRDVAGGVSDNTFRMQWAMATLELVNSGFTFNSKADAATANYGIHQYSSNDSTVNLYNSILRYGDYQNPSGATRVWTTSSGHNAPSVSNCIFHAGPSSGAQSQYIISATNNAAPPTIKNSIVAGVTIGANWQNCVYHSLVNSGTPVDCIQVDKSVQDTWWVDADGGDFTPVDLVTGPADLVDTGIDTSAETGSSLDINGNDRNDPAAGAGWDIGPYEWGFAAEPPTGGGSNVIGGAFRTLGIPSAPTYPDRRVTIGVPYTANLSSGWQFSDGSDFTIDALPTGLSMSTAGIVTGTPTVLPEVTVSTVSHMGLTSNAFTWTVVTRPPSGTLADAKFDALRDQGFTGSISDMTLQWLQANGATSGSITDAWLEVLPGTGQRNDRWYTVLGGMGYTGSLNDREFAFWVDGGVLPGTVDVGPANLEAFLISEGWGVTRTGENFVVRSGVHEWRFTWSEAEAGVYEQDLPAPLRNDIDDSFGR
jgi:hypothetical protein